MDYVGIQTDEGMIYGGNQNRFSNKKLKGYGCGLIAAADVSWYLSDKENVMEWRKYESYISRVKKYFFYLPYFGMNGYALSLGINLIFLKNKIPFRAHWCLKPISKKSLIHIKAMLDQKLPVIIAIGPNFPNIFGKRQLAYYRRDFKGNYVRAGSVNKHFVVITEMKDGYFKISTWGKLYYLKCEDYIDYCRKNSMPFFSNYLKIFAV